MPLVRIDIGAGYQAGLGREVGEVIYRAMHEEINVPADDKFQIITTHAVSELVFPKSYLGIEYSQGIVFIQITLNEGRTTELKKRFYKRIANDCSKELGIREQDILISLIEVNKENWSFGNGEMQYGPAI
jgi:phenylpyruvate tautomerase PptA (4-oxalocrotonate tautomerase family)